MCATKKSSSSDDAIMQTALVQPGSITGIQELSFVAMLGSRTQAKGSKCLKLAPLAFIS